MKILITTGIFLPGIGGPATYVAKLAKEFLKLDHEVTVVTYSDQLYPEIDDNLDYKVRRIIRGNKFSNYWRYYKKLTELNNHTSYDLIYSFDHFSAGIPAVLVNHKFKRPLFIRVGGDFIWERYLDKNNNLVTLSQFYKQRWHLSAEKLRFQIIKWVFKKTSKIIFTTKFQSDIFQKYYNLPENKLTLIKNPIDKNFTKQYKPNNSKQIIFAGRFINKNNIKNLIQAFVKIKDQSFSLYLIGEGPIKPELEKLIAEGDNIHLENKLTGQDLVNRLLQAYLVVFPSVTDISPNLMLDCLQLGVPFISSQEIGFDWLKDKVNTFDPLQPEEITQGLDKLLDVKAYQDYLNQLSKIEYNYTYQQAAEDTLKLLGKHEPR